jgi:hypothetical protein
MQEQLTLNYLNFVSNRNFMEGVIRQVSKMEGHY